MKNKIIATIIILCMTASIIYGCGLLVTNNERDYQQVIATVGNEDYKDEITKKQLVSLYLSHGSTYVSSYGYTVGQTMELMLTQLINNRVLVQESAKALIADRQLSGTLKDYLAKDSVTGKKSTSLIRLLGGESSQGRVNAYSNTYKYMRNTLDSYEKQVKEDWAAETPSDAPTPTPTPTPTATPRPTKIPATLPTETPLTTEDPYPTSASRIEAYKRLLEDLKEEKKTYEEIFEETLVSYLENELISEYQKLLYKDINITFDQLEERRTNILIQQQQEYGIDFDAYTTDLKNADENTIILCNPLSGYGYVKNLLISFTGDLAEQLAESQNKDWSKAQYLSVRSELLEQIEVKDLREGISEEEREENKSIQEFYTYFKGLFGGTDADSDGVYSYVPGGFDTSLIDTFEDLIFQYGSDPGMFNNAMDYLSQPKPEAGGTETYVTEFADAARAVVKAGVGSYTLVGTDYGWHLIICTEIVGNKNQNLNESDYAKIVADLSKYDELGKDVKDTFTYKLYNAMRDEIKNNIYSNKVAELVKDYKDANKIVKYEDRYSNLTSIG